MNILHHYIGAWVSWNWRIYTIAVYTCIYSCMILYTIYIVPRPLETMFKYHSEIHGHATRHSDDPRIPIVLKELVRSINYRGPYLWMNLDDKLKKISSTNSFKCQMKKRTIMEYWSDDVLSDRLIHMAPCEWGVIEFTRHGLCYI